MITKEAIPGCIFITCLTLAVGGFSYYNYYFPALADPYELESIAQHCDKYPELALSATKMMESNGYISRYELAQLKRQLQVAKKESVRKEAEDRFNKAFNDLLEEALKDRRPRLDGE